MSVRTKASKIVSYDTKSDRPTQTAYQYLQAAYDWFNQELWDGKLPQCLIVLHRHKGAYGYFCANRLQKLDADGSSIDEIALNPQHIATRPAEETISTLVHEMAHLWQQHCGEPPRKCYHDKQWAAEMDRIGLSPSSTGMPGGKRTGQRVSHYIVKHGPFQEAFRRWKESKRPGLYGDLHLPVDSDEEEKEKPKSKVKFTCPKCAVNAWGKPKLFILCGECEVRMEAEVKEGGDDAEEGEESGREAG